MSKFINKFVYKYINLKNNTRLYRAFFILFFLFTITFFRQNYCMKNILNAINFNAHKKELNNIKDFIKGIKAKSKKDIDKFLNREETKKYSKAIISVYSKEMLGITKDICKSFGSEELEFIIKYYNSGHSPFKLNKENIEILNILCSRSNGFNKNKSMDEQLAPKNKSIKDLNIEILEKDNIVKMVKLLLPFCDIELLKKEKLYILNENTNIKLFKLFDFNGINTAEKLAVHAEYKEINDFKNLYNNYKKDKDKLNFFLCQIKEISNEKSNLTVNEYNLALDNLLEIVYYDSIKQIARLKLKNSSANFDEDSTCSNSIFYKLYNQFCSSSNNMFLQNIIKNFYDKQNLIENKMLFLPDLVTAQNILNRHISNHTSNKDAESANKHKKEPKKTRLFEKNKITKNSIITKDAKDDIVKTAIVKTVLFSKKNKKTKQETLSVSINNNINNNFLEIKDTKVLTPKEQNSNKITLFKKPQLKKSTSSNMLLKK